MELDLSDEEQNFDEYNEKNRLVNDVNYSYYIHKKQNSQNNNNFDNNSENSMNNSFTNNINESNSENNDLNANNTQSKLSTPYNKYNYNPNRITSSIDIKADERERKKILLDNIKTQMNLRKKTKLEELQKTKEEDAKYLREMFEKYPFGRGGGGAPNRNKRGDVLTFRRNLISDLKYNQMDLNVDDDYDEVRGNRKTFNNDMNWNDRYTPSQRPYSTNNITNNWNNNLSSSLDYMNYNKDFELKMKLLELKREEEEIKNEELREENNKLENDLYLQTKINKKYANSAPIEENEEENETTNTNNIIENNYNIQRILNSIQPTLNPRDYYDNYNFVPKGQIHPRLDNNFLFSEELANIRKDLQMNQSSLFKQISTLKEASIIAKNERDKVYKDLELIKYQINKLNEQNKNKEEQNEDEVFITNNLGVDYDNYIIKDLKKNENDYDYIDDMFFDKYQKELPYKSKIKKQKKIFHLQKNYEDKNLVELDKLIKKSDDIMQNFKENEMIEKKFKKKPENYFDTSDYFFDTYMLNHKDDYLEYANDYNKVNNKFMEMDIGKNNNYNEDYEINVEKI